MIDPQLLHAYRQTRYRVEPGDGEAFELRIDQPCPALDALLNHHGADCAAFLTACNPCSQALDEAANRARMQALAQDIANQGLTALAGTGLPADAHWPPEPSLLVLDMDAAAALQLAEAHRQYAIVFHAPGEPSRLLLTALGEAA